jgi:hypothetical protein
MRGRPFYFIQLDRLEKEEGANPAVVLMRLWRGRQRADKKTNKINAEFREL